MSRQNSSSDDMMVPDEEISKFSEVNVPDSVSETKFMRQRKGHLVSPRILNNNSYQAKS